MSGLYPVGLGDVNATFRVYVQNRPKAAPYLQLMHLQALECGEIDQIYLDCGNGWRKLFNVYAKLLYELSPSFVYKEPQGSWQQYRDSNLLQQGSGTALLFSPPDFKEPNVIHLIAGRNCAKEWLNQGLLECDLLWLSEEFAIDTNKRVLVTPYFDYRQLTNEKIRFAAQLLSPWLVK